MNLAIRSLVWLLLLALLWALPSVVASQILSTRFSYDDDIVLAHLQLVFSTAMGVASSAVLFSVWFSRNGRSVNVFSILTVAWITSLCLFYIVMFTGLLSWNRVPTFSLIRVYADQMAPLMGAIGVSISAAIIGLSLATMLWIFCWYLLARVTVSQTANNLSKYQILRSPNAKLALSLICVVCAYPAAKTWVDFTLLSHGENRDEPITAFFELNDLGTGSVAIVPYLERLGDAKRGSLEQAARLNYVPAGSLNKPNIILITIDALRPDHLALYGYPRETTPFLSQLKQQGKLTFGREARSACAESSCGILSLLSGKQPHEMLGENFGLPEVLAVHGYKRIYMLSGDHTNFYGLRRSYGQVDHYRDGTDSGAYVNDDQALLVDIDKLGSATPGTPYFMYFHLMSAHGLGSRSSIAWRPQSSLYRPGASLENTNLEEIINGYDNGVLSADDTVRRVVTALKQKAYLTDDTIVLVTADHGESLGQHGVKSHAESLFESVIRIPWIWLNGAPYSDLNQPTIQADFAPTVLRALRMPIPSHWSGQPLQEPSARTTYHAQPPLAAAIFSSTTERYKLIHDFSSGQTKLFDLLNDPNEAAAIRSHSWNARSTALTQKLFEKGYGGLARK
jgi:glucan phosphoethanolaminetransferase (alkaline phosphatase superfamily)